MDICQENFIVTLSDVSNGSPQTISIWNLNDEERDEPVCSTTFAYSKDKYQHFVKFSTSNIEDIVTNGDETVVFFSWSKNLEQHDMVYYEPNIAKNTFPKKEKADAKYS